MSDIRVVSVNFSMYIFRSNFNLHSTCYTIRLFPLLAMYSFPPNGKFSTQILLYIPYDSRQMLTLQDLVDYLSFRLSLRRKWSCDHCNFSARKQTHVNNFNSHRIIFSHWDKKLSIKNLDLLHYIPDIMQSNMNIQFHVQLSKISNFSPYICVHSPCFFYQYTKDEP